MPQKEQFQVDFIGIGSAKAGTTSLSQKLADHPNICFARQKETDFLSYNFHKRTIAQYARSFPKKLRGQVRGEFTVGYFDHPDAPRNAATLFPNAKLLLTIREPVSQLYSLYWHLKRQNFHTGDPKQGQLGPEQALEAYSERLLGPVLLGSNIERWLNYFSREQLLVIHFDELRTDQAMALKPVWRHLGLDEPEPDDSTIQTERARGGRSPRPGMIGSIGPYVYEFTNSTLYKPLKRVIGPELGASLKEIMRLRQAYQALFTQPGYPQIGAQFAEACSNLLEPEIRKAEQLLGEAIPRFDHRPTQVTKHKGANNSNPPPS